MKEFIEKLIGRLEEERDYEPIDYDYCDMSCTGEEHFISTHKAIEIVNELAEEHKDRTIIDGQYCWQTCGATEHCKECNRLGNGSIDYFENYDFMAEEHTKAIAEFSEKIKFHLNGIRLNYDDAFGSTVAYKVIEDVEEMVEVLKTARGSE